MQLQCKNTLGTKMGDLCFSAALLGLHCITVCTCAAYLEIFAGAKSHRNHVMALKSNFACFIFARAYTLPHTQTDPFTGAKCDLTSHHTVQLHCWSKDRNGRTRVAFMKAMVRGCHVYNDNWSAIAGTELPCSVKMATASVSLWWLYTTTCDLQNYSFFDNYGIPAIGAGSSELVLNPNWWSKYEQTQISYFRIRKLVCKICKNLHQSKMSSYTSTVLWLRPDHLHVYHCSISFTPVAAFPQ